MSRRARAAFLLGSALLWGAVLLLGAEAFERARWKRAQADNPYIRAWSGAGIPEPGINDDVFSEELLDTALRDRFRGPGQTREPLPAWDAAAALRARAAHFLTLDNERRRAFSAAYRIQVLALSADGGILGAYGPAPPAPGEPLGECVGAEAAARASAACGGAAETFSAPLDGGDRLFHARPFTGDWRGDGAPATALFFENTRQPLDLPDDNDLWASGFFTYRPLAALRQRVEVSGRGAEFAINNAGFRDDNVVLPKPPGVFRIVCVGASTTEEGPANDLTYPNLLEFYLNRTLGGRRVDVVNAGVSGMNSDKHVLKLADYFLLEPDMIVVYNAVNDISHSLLPKWVGGASVPGQAVRSLRVLDGRLNPLTLPGEAEQRRDIRAKMANLAFLCDQAAARGVRTALCTFAAPLPPEELPPVERDFFEFITRRSWGGKHVSYASYLRTLALYNGEIGALCRERGIPCLPLADRVRGGKEVFGDICHMKNRGIERKARALAEMLLPLLPEGLSAGAAPQTPSTGSPNN